MKNLRLRCEERGSAEVRRRRKTRVRLCLQRFFVLSFLCLVSAIGGMFATTSYPGTSKASASSSCVGDCDDDGVVTVDEIVLLVNIVLDVAPISSCPTLAGPPDVADIVLAINAALTGCAETATPTPSATPTSTPIILNLLEGSLIEYSSGVGAGAPVQSEPLVGTFVLGNPRYELQFAVLDVLDVSMRSESFTISPASPGVTGTARISLDVPPLFTMEMISLVSGVTVAFAGEVALQCCSFPQEIHDLNMCGILTEEPASCEDIRIGSARGYVVRIFAAPE